jgi:rod shape determining protein RodA
MMNFDPVSWIRRLFAPIDAWLFGILSATLAGAFVVMMSASPERFQSHCMNILVGMTVLWLTAHMRPQRLYNLALPLYVIGVLLLVAVAVFGENS